MMLIHKSQRLTDGNYKLIYTYNTWSTCSKTINSLDELLPNYLHFRQVIER